MINKDAAAFMTGYLGYKNVSLTSFSKDAIYAMLKKKLPVYISGAYWPKGGTRQGHAWVIDGWSRQQRAVYTYSMKTHALLGIHSQYRELFHCNYGWRALCDGYYFPGIFTLNKKPEYWDIWIGDTGNYRKDLPNLDSDLQIITYSPFL